MNSCIKFTMSSASNGIARLPQRQNAPPVYDPVHPAPNAVSRSWWRAAAGVPLVLGGSALMGLGVLASFVPGGGVLFQAGVSTMMYGGYSIAQLWCADIREDMNDIGWNMFNSNQDAVLNSRKVSFYRGVPVVRQNLGNFSFGVIGLCESLRHDPIELQRYVLSHEFGHNIQLMILGPLFFTGIIAIPSLISAGFWTESHENLWFERWADQMYRRFVNRNHRRPL